MQEEIRAYDSGIGYRVIIEDDGRVAYAYLLAGESIVSDVWLYNCGIAPIKPEWRDRSKLPFQNPKDYVRNTEGEATISPRDISVEWVVSNNSVKRAVLEAHGEILAIVEPGVKPGWCSNAVRDGPLALALHETTRSELGL